MRQMPRAFQRIEKLNMKSLWNNPGKSGKGTEVIEDQEKDWGHLEQSTVEIE